jgi:hypothetical protein
MQALADCAIHTVSLAHVQPRSHNLPIAAKVTLLAERHGFVRIPCALRLICHLFSLMLSLKPQETSTIRDGLKQTASAIANTRKAASKAEHN